MATGRFRTGAGLAEGLGAGLAGTSPWEKQRALGGRWNSGDTLDQGGQTQVILVEDLMGQYQGPCALKRVFNAERHERFRDKVDAIKILSHPNIVPLLDHSALDAVPGDDAQQNLVMPRAKGGKVTKAVDRYRGRLDDVLTVAIQIARGLQAAPAACIIHRDVRPENILFPGEGHAIWVADSLCAVQRTEVDATSPPRQGRPMGKRDV
ncbi:MULTISPECIES: protein kinase domain-containing protein [Bradyrhizobium]|uniref:non-specific serine/threonine protein kinase n=1 Tax=Bradyrhizobium elkanii TaxID=29448 RepID=A0A8I1YKU5_BRAEL|nr:protein kinase [Bradyrhizobium elkanii]MBP1299891.1 serine/threonine-protein kinase [Bradyrhizobium elkanii]WLB82960.1 protein kinase [Bradyrhizobium elkanii]